MDLHLKTLKDFKNDLIKMRDQSLDRFIFSELSDKEIHEIRGMVLGISKILLNLQNILDDYLKNSDLPYNLRILEEEAKKYNIGMSDSGAELKGKYNENSSNHIKYEHIY
jgi:hypothetical protein